MVDEFASKIDMGNSQAILSYGWAAKDCRLSNAREESEPRTWGMR